jgi:ParB family chromosome partitioning protein
MMELRSVDISEIQPNPFQPRRQFDDESLAELAESLKSRGEIQPIIVRRFEKGYQIIAGERRWRAAKLAGLKEIPVLIRQTAEDEVLLESIIENLHRKDLESAERENAMASLWKTGKWKNYVELGQMLGKSEYWVRTNIDAASIREMEKIPNDVATRTIVSTATLNSEERKQIIEKVRQEEIPEKEVREYVRVVKEASEPIKRELLKPKSVVTPKMAETIVEKLPGEEEQSLVLGEIRRFRLTEDEVEDRVRDIQRAKEAGEPLRKEMGVQEGTFYTVGEYECPHCKKHYQIKCDGKRDWVE